ncbi:MAG TPA: UDP-N-acetylmuramate:L-alanyl-gamma-D-glutamyl-meso-diaminopimelate ligase [Candidatus Competibacteraceae bacterium]|nr:UDP-N-acetylmuramate:L-alanyl-gamma-D-glutamyl-meso-diaminopimelate ligase [Candidatus Competibacteraceae bacterium]
MDLHILGICGTFMAGVALLARALGHSVSGSDANAYPPMSTQLASLGIRVCEGYAPAHLDEVPDLIIVGNAMTRGNPMVEAALARGIPYVSGPQWLYDEVLKQRWVLAVAGTHGKTTTSSLLAWILEEAGLQPGFLIGGIPANFGVSARLGQGPFFVVEADEYDTAFFDKRSKFVHYRPRTAVLNNLEYDHADIFPDLAAIQRQFHHLVRTVPGNGLIVANGADANLAETLQMGCWTPVETFATGDWEARAVAADGSAFTVCLQGQPLGRVQWSQLGQHNVHNALAAIAAARHVGVPPVQAIAALASFQGVKRRLELRGEAGGVQVYDDFAHHPTAIATTLAGLKARHAGRVIAVLEPRSNTMKAGVFKDSLAPSLAAADAVVLYQDPQLGWSLEAVTAGLNGRARVLRSIADVVAAVVSEARPGDAVLVMSNGGFGGIHQKLLEALGG